MNYVATFTNRLRPLRFTARNWDDALTIAKAHDSQLVALVQATEPIKPDQSAKAHHLALQLLGLMNLPIVIELQGGKDVESELFTSIKQEDEETGEIIMILMH